MRLEEIGIETGVETAIEQKIGIETGVETVVEQEIGIEKYQSLPESQRCILIYTVQNEMITITELAKKLGMARSTVALHIDQLKQQNLLIREGSTKKGRWVILKQDKLPKKGN